MKQFVAFISLALVLVSGLTGCSNTWSGIKQDTRRAGQATGQSIEKAGEKIQEISK